MSHNNDTNKTNEIQDNLEKEAQEVFDIFEGYALLREDYTRLDKRNVIEAYKDLCREKASKQCQLYF